MERASELVGLREEQTKERFFNLCNDLAAAAFFPNDNKKINELKEVFFKNYDDFLSAGFSPEGNINSVNLEKIEEYRNIEWDQNKLKEILEYIRSLR
jgi:hypothetical protein